MQGCLKMIPIDTTFLLRIYFITNFSRVSDGKACRSFYSIFAHR